VAETLTIRPMSDSDLPSVLDTMRAALGETALLRRTPEQWHWKHTLNPFGRSIVLVAADGDRVAAVRAFMRWRLATPDGGELSCVRAVDTAVHPDYQRRGLFRSLNEAALDVARDDGVDLVFNTPNAQSRPGYLRQGWRDVGPIGVMIRPSLKMFTRHSRDELPKADDVLAGAERATGISGSDRAPLGLRTVRSEAYWRWRFEQHPTASYLRVDEAGSTAVLRVNRRSGRDELIVSELVGAAGHRAIAAAAKGSLAAYFVAWFSQGSPERREAIRAGMIPVPRVTALNLVAQPLSPVSVDVFDMANWDLALSDLELL
jgi:GNAT superfamily N-acetyltransferase